MSTIPMKDPSLVYVSALVIGLHAALLLWVALAMEVQPPAIPKPRERLIVKTIPLGTPPPPVQAVKKVEPIAAVSPETAPEIKVEAPKPKPAPPKKIEKKKATPKPVAEKAKPKPPPAKKADPMPAKQKELLAQAQASMAKIKTTKLPKLQVLPDISREEMSSWTTAEVGYRDELASRLQILLRLPEYGEVKIKLTLARTGRVIKLTVLSAESSVNRKYIEKTLPTLTFPPFDRNFQSEAEHTFSITLNASN